MAIPYFYMDWVEKGATVIFLEEDTSRHIVQVLRMEAGEMLSLTDGLGNLHTAEIVQVHKKSTGVKILSSAYHARLSPKISIAISLIKNVARFEWFLEKATEIGVSEIIPLICERTEKHHFRLDRMKGILVSAMLQSQQYWLPVLSNPVILSANIDSFDYPQKFIAYCDETGKHAISELYQKQTGVLILIGPEGDFTKKEIGLALAHHFVPVTLGDTRLRTETAGIVAATLLRHS